MYVTPVRLLVRVCARCSFLVGGARGSVLFHLPRRRGCIGWAAEEKIEAEEDEEESSNPLRLCFAIYAAALFLF
uniref:Putative secreted protein n=1 Tax=Anopheles marajoara TaxID=58244 RepID=A0A2M4CDC0_9DIPT